MLGALLRGIGSHSRRSCSNPNPSGSCKRFLRQSGAIWRISPGLKCSRYSSTWETLAAEDNRERHQHGADADHREAGADAAHAGVAGEQAARSEEHRDGDDI